MSGYYRSRKVGTALANRQIVDKNISLGNFNYRPQSVDTVWSFRDRTPSSTDTSDIQAMLDSSRVDSLRGPLDTGHPYWVNHFKCSAPQRLVSNTPQEAHTFDGYVYAEVPAFTSALPLQVSGDGAQIRAFPSINEMNSFAQKAMIATLPTRTHANVAAALGELLIDRKLPELMLSIVAHRGISKKTLSDEFLNYQFGILPLVSDIQRICAAVIDSNKIINDFIEGSGKVTYRHWNNKASGLPDVQLLTNVSAKTTNYSAGNLFVTSDKKLTVQGSPVGSYYGSSTSVLQNETRQWRFAGAWSYLLSKDSTFVSRMARFEQLANNLLGTRITLDVLWELVPWSWLADWFLNIQQFLQINQALQNDSLVLQFGYLTCITRQTTLISLHFDGRSNVNTHDLSTFFTCERKERIRANPYGFGVITANLSGTQLAILAALGFSRGR